MEAAADTRTRLVTAVDAAARERSAAAVRTALDALSPAEIDSFLHASFAPAADRTRLTTGLGASPGAAAGAVVLSAEDALAAGERGQAVILVRDETTPDDVLGMQAARGIVTTRGGAASHAAVVARGWGIPAVVGAGEIVLDEDGLRVGDVRVAPGTAISIDGRTGEVWIGASGITTEEAPPQLATLLTWADQVRRRAQRPVAVRANADTAADAAHARHLGAEGIGLCRTEHMFLAADRLPLVRRFILTDDPGEEEAALAELERAQRTDFEDLLAAMDGLPITIRLLDPPLHEFLPALERLVVSEAVGTIDDEGRRELAAVRRLHEVNPMIGTRGVRLGIVRPGLYEMQIRALLAAVLAERERGRRPDVEILIPLVVTTAEMTLARRWVSEAAACVGFDGSVPVGAMIETPRAALLADDLANVADFFSFGTNDLTQLVFGFSRDDVSSHLLPAYLRRGILEADPFDTLDAAGVGRIIEHACHHGRAASPDIKIGVCGEQAGDPGSAGFLVGAGVDYVSCSPYRIPIARLAVAQALLQAERVPDEVLAALVGEGQVEPLPSPAPQAPAPADTGEDRASTEFLVLHALRVKGFAPADLLAEIAGLDLPTTERLLAELAAHGQARHMPARGLWSLLPPGKERHLELLGAAPHGELTEMHQAYERFLDRNSTLKELCSRWQLRDGEPNDHSDRVYDAACIADLHVLHATARDALDAFAARVPRFASYPRRLADALARLDAGETRMFTGVMCGSFHDVWMELHEDLVQLLGIDRHAEGSY